MTTRSRVRGGFSLVELLIALTITAIIGVAMTALFVTQARFFEQQQKLGFARGVTRSATNIMMSELRMLERDSGVISAMDTAIVVRVPFAMGLVCTATATTLTISVLPVDSTMWIADTAAFQAGVGGYAYRQANGTYKYASLATAPTSTAATNCTNAPTNIAVLTAEGGAAKALATNATGAGKGQPVILYHNVRYHFNSSSTVSGRRGLYRLALGVDEEIVAPFDTSAKFQFFVNDAKTSQASAPASLKTLTGIDIILNSISEKPNGNGTYTVVPLRTAVFFKNRRT